MVIPILLFFTSCKDETSHNIIPVAKNGVLDLSMWNFTQDGPLQLNGEWKVHWKKIYSLNELINIETVFQTPDQTQIPLYWNKRQLVNEPNPGLGYATYFLKLENLP